MAMRDKSYNTCETLLYLFDRRVFEMLAKPWRAKRREKRRGVSMPSMAEMLPKAVLIA